MWFRVIFTISIVAGLVASADAQVRRGDAPKPKMERFAADGTVQGIAAGKIWILTNTNQKWLILIDPKATIHVVGTAELDFLKLGHFIRFTAAVDQRGRVQEKIGELALFTPRQPAEIGVWPEGDDTGDDTGDDNTTDQFDDGTNRRPPVATVRLYSIAGRIVGIRKGKVTVNAGRGMFQIELAEQPKITVDLADYSVVRQGDKISIRKGKMPPVQVPPGQVGWAKATELTIEMAHPLTGPRKPRPVKPKP